MRLLLAYDTAGRIVSMGDVAFGFDEATGRRISAKRSGEESVTYTWTEAGRLEHFADPARDTSATHTYDGNGQRTTSVVRHGSVTTTTTWTYDGLTLLAYATERSDGATSALTYLTSEGGRPIAGVWSSSEASAPVRFSIDTNDRGDVVALADASGEVFATYGYDAFGAPRSDLTASRETSAALHAEAIAAEQPLRYAGYVFDTHSGLYYCSQRYYDPQTIQFLTKDPARADGEESAYQYCGGDPVGKVDPTGLWAVNLRVVYVSHTLLWYWHSVQWVWRGGDSRRALIRHEQYRVVVGINKLFGEAVSWVMLAEGVMAVKAVRVVGPRTAALAERTGAVKIVGARTEAASARFVAYKRADVIMQSIAAAQAGRVVAKWLGDLRVRRETRDMIYYEIPLGFRFRERWL